MMFMATSGNLASSGAAEEFECVQIPTVPFVINRWCRKCWPDRHSNLASPDRVCSENCKDAVRNEDPIITILWPPIPQAGVQQTNVVVRPPPANFDFSHTQYLPCGYGRQCKHGLACTRSHSNPPQAEIAYWNYMQPLGKPNRRRRAANGQKNTGKDWSLTAKFECRVCGVRMNSAAQLAQHESGSKHKAQLAASLLKASGGGPPSVGVMPHGTGPHYEGQVGHRGVGATLPLEGAMSIKVAELEVTPTAGNAGETFSSKDDPASMEKWAFGQAYVTAVKSGDNAEVSRLLAAGVDVDTRDAGCPALHWAIFMGRVETVEVLVKAGAAKDLQDEDNQTAVHICLHPRHGMMNQLKRASSAGAESIDYEKQALRVIGLLMHAGWSPNARDALGRTGLHHVAEQGNCALAYILLQYEANPTIVNADGYSPIDVATLKAKSEGLPKFVQLRDILNTASFDAKNSSGIQPSPMAIPATDGGYDSASSTRQGSSLSTAPKADDRRRYAGTAPSDTSSSVLPPPTLPPIGAEIRETGESDPFGDVDSAFRPLMAALMSLSSQDVYSDSGVGMSHLVLRLEPVLENIGIDCETYVHHASKAGLVEISEASNSHQKLVSLAARFSPLITRPGMKVDSSSTIANSPLSQSTGVIPSSQSLVWHRKDTPASKASGMEQSAVAKQKGFSAPRSAAMSYDGSQSLAQSDASNFNYAAPTGDKIADEGRHQKFSNVASSENTPLSKISDSFRADPFANAARFGPEPLFGRASNYEPQQSIASSKRSALIGEPHAAKSPWERDGLNRRTPWGSSLHGIPGSHSMIDLSQSSLFSEGHENDDDDDDGWPSRPADGPVPRSGSLPLFGSSTPPGLDVNKSRDGSWFSTKPAKDWSASTIADLQAPMQWLNLEPSECPGDAQPSLE